MVRAALRETRKKESVANVSPLERNKERSLDSALRPGSGREPAPVGITAKGCSQA